MILPAACFSQHSAGAGLHDVQLAAHRALPREVLSGPEPDAESKNRGWGNPRVLLEDGCNMAVIWLENCDKYPKWQKSDWTMAGIWLKWLENGGQGVMEATKR